MNIRPKIDSIKGSMFHRLPKNVKNAKITSKQSKVITSGKFFLLEVKIPATIPIINPGNPARAKKGNPKNLPNRR